MNLLIVEDEKMAREGLLKILEWEQVGIKRVFSAENGEDGLVIAKRIIPDIVLTDIRMPRMDGITMAAKIKKVLPECRVIFLSAYAEIDYYKAAIDLKAVRYLDKPIEADRLREVILEAVAECNLLRRYKSTHELYQMQEKKKLADAICMNEIGNELDGELKNVGLHLKSKGKDAFVVSIIIQFRLDYEDENMEDQMNLASALSEVISCTNIYTIRQKSHIVFFLFSGSDITAYHSKMMCDKMKTVLGDRVYSIAVGHVFRGVINANKSYNTAKMILGKVYLYPWRTVIHYGEDAGKSVNLSAYAEEKSEILNSLFEDQSVTIASCDALYKKIADRGDLMYNKARELYFEIISEVFHKADSMQLRVREESGKMISWVVRIENFNLDELHDFLTRQVYLITELMEKGRSEKRQISAIKDYIFEHYSDESFSVSDISEFLHLSAAHVCTMFKKETGNTINGYLTDHRLKKARQYLLETPLTVAEISIKVGYRDNSYFGKIFRKHFGMTPNEYRNR